MATPLNAGQKLHKDGRQDYGAYFEVVFPLKEFMVLHSYITLAEFVVLAIIMSA